MLLSSGENTATLLYGPNGFRVIKPGRFVACAVSGQPIALDALRDWSVDRLEADARAERTRGGSGGVAVGGLPIALGALRHWRVDRQEARAIPMMATRRSLG